MTSFGVFAAIFDDEARLLCVKQNYGPRRWTLPGGKVEPHENPLEALVREIHEETGFHARVGEFVGAYAFPYNDDVVLFFTANITGRDESWQSDGEISEQGFFPVDNLPEPMSPRTARRIQDTVQGRRGVMHVFDPSPD